jgi:cation:H+ antiporter
MTPSSSKDRVSGLAGAVHSPVAPELPEILNAIIWVRAGKTQLALANISGAMMIQATVPSGIGIVSGRGNLTHRCCWPGS